MKKANILIVYGTRPEAIKLAPVILKIRNVKRFDVTVVNTGQHLEMTKEVEEDFCFKADEYLSIMKKNQSLNHIMISVISAMTELFSKYTPDLVMIQGDTTTVLATAIAAFYSKIEVAHVEAGLRTYDLYHPFPEEFNRKVVSQFASFNFTPSEIANTNLLKEQTSSSTLFHVGNTVVDALSILSVQNRINNPFPAKSKNLLITAHRRENHGQGIEQICEAVQETLNHIPELNIYWPVHPNPNVFDVVHRKLGNLNGVRLLDPLSYNRILGFVKFADFIWTDSGGIQEECIALEKKVLILRKVTERPEVVNCGLGELVSTDVTKIVEKTIQHFDHKTKVTAFKNPYGYGQAAEKIIGILKEKLL